MSNKVELEGDLFILVEEDDEEGVSICAEMSGINIWDWLVMNEKNRVKITLEKLDD